MKVHHYSKALSWITRPRVTETATLETFTPELDRMDFNPGGRVGMKPGGLVEPGVTHYGKEIVEYDDGTASYRSKYKSDLRNPDGTKKTRTHYFTVFLYYWTPHSYRPRPGISYVFL